MLQPRLSCLVSFRWEEREDDRLSAKMLSRPAIMVCQLCALAKFVHEGVAVCLPTAYQTPSEAARRLQQTSPITLRFVYLK